MRPAMKSNATSSSFFGITVLAAAILMVTMGARQTLGLFVAPIDTTTGLGIISISLALAIAQFVWGLVQPIAGALADRYGHARVVMGGILLAALGNALTPYMSSTEGLILSLGLLTAAGTGAASFSVLIGITAQRVAPEKRGMSSGIINAGGSFGQFVFAPVTQLLISGLGWMGAMWSLAVLTLGALPVTAALRRRAASSAASTAGAGGPVVEPAATAGAPAQSGIKAAVCHAFADRSYLLLNAGFFTCGFHIAFLVTHLPGEVRLCGLPPQVASWSLGIIGLANIVGSLLAGWSLQFYRGKHVLFFMYASRALLILLYLAAPKTALTFYLFAAGLGLTWLATVPPTAGVVGKLFGMRYLATLFGLTLLSHQVGAFFGAWLGGIAVTELGNYAWMWYADIALAAMAALLNLPIREGRVTALLKPA
jgi:MFS family permease